VFDIGLPEFFILGVIALLVFGPERLPEVALQAGRLIRRLRGMAESARSELAADLEPHMRELSELRELNPRKMAKRYVLDPVNEDGTLKGLRGKGLLAPSETRGKAKGQAKSPSAGESSSGDPATAADDTSEAHQSNGTAAGDASGPVLPPAMAPAVTPAGARPPYDTDAT
jgi:sec-independent protein translocase protein TatB